MLYRLLCGGTHCIAIESIRLMESRKNYGIITQTIYLFDGMVSGIRPPGLFWRTIHQEHEDTLKHLINNYLKSSIKKYDDYIYRTFECFVKHKKQIYIDFIN